MLLAAGASTRFGSPKMLAPVGDDRKPLLQKVCETWLEAGIDNLLIVLGCNARDIRATIGENLLRRGHTEKRLATESSVRFVENPHWQDGMFTSVKVGLAAVSPASTHIAISPADLPFLSKSSLRTVLDAARSVEASHTTVVVPTHARSRGHPLVISAALAARVLSWPDSARLNRLFAEPDVKVLHLEGFDASILHDVDRAEDLLT